MENEKENYFELGRVVITRGLDEAMKHNPEAQWEVVEAFNRYKGQDWGDLDEDDKQLNDEAIKSGQDRILARYEINSLNDDIYIITKWDRSATTLLFCNEY